MGAGVTAHDNGATGTSATTIIGSYRDGIYEFTTCCDRCHQPTDDPYPLLGVAGNLTICRICAEGIYAR